MAIPGRDCGCDCSPTPTPFCTHIKSPLSPAVHMARMPWCRVRKTESYRSPVCAPVESSRYRLRETAKSRSFHGCWGCYWQSDDYNVGCSVGCGQYFRIPPGEWIVVKIVLRERESASEAVRRFRKIVERSGLKREMRRRERYEKPSDIRRRKKMRAIRKTKMNSPPR